MILLIDNFDSFAYNLARYLERLGQEVLVVRNNGLSLADVHGWKPQAIVLSPGPCTPLEAGCCLELVREFHTTIPMLGVCLGHQTIAAALGANIVRAAVPMHGRTSHITHTGSGIFSGLPSPMEVCRYHSLVVEPGSLPAELEVTARTVEGTVMAVAHRQFPVVGMQFHPESILSSYGYPLLAGFLREARIEHHSPAELWEAEIAPPNTERDDTLPDRPVTF